jgi:hypothetical protein
VMRRLIAVATAGLLVLGPAVGASEAQDDLFAGVNRHRIALDRRPVRADPRMMRRSQRHAEQMAEAGDLFHSQLRLPERATWAGETIGSGGSIRVRRPGVAPFPGTPADRSPQGTDRRRRSRPWRRPGYGSSSRSQSWRPDDCAIHLGSHTAEGLLPRIPTGCVLLRLAVRRGLPVRLDLEEGQLLAVRAPPHPDDEYRP